MWVPYPSRFVRRVGQEIGRKGGPPACFSAAPSCCWPMRCKPNQPWRRLMRVKRRVPSKQVC